MTVISIVDAGLETIVEFDTKESRKDAIERIFDHTALNGLGLKMWPESPGIIARTNTIADRSESMLREAEVQCQMLIDILEEALPLLGPDRDKCDAWSKFLHSEFGRQWLHLAEGPLEDQKRTGIPLDERKEDGYVYRNLSRKPEVIKAGKDWLADLWKQNP